MTTIQENVRADLATIIGEQFEHQAPQDDCRVCPDVQRAAAAVEVMGYRKPRTVTTAEGLDALPFEAVIRDAEGHVLERWGDAEHVQWSTPGCKWFVPATEIALPVTVLYEVQP